MTDYEISKLSIDELKKEIFKSKLRTVYYKLVYIWAKFMLFIFINICKPIVLFLENAQ